MSGFGGGPGGSGNNGGNYSYSAKRFEQDNRVLTGVLKPIIATSVALQLDPTAPIAKVLLVLGLCAGGGMLWSHHHHHHANQPGASQLSHELSNATPALHGSPAP